MILYKESYDILNNLLNNCIGNFSSVLITGDYGKGKTTLIKQACEYVSRPYLSVCQYPGMSTPYEALYSALSQKLEDDNYDIANINHEISHREYVKQLLVSICKQTPDIIVVFQDMKDYDYILVELIKESIHYLSIHEIPCCIIIEFSTDNLSFEQREFLSTCRDICISSIKLDCNICSNYIDYFFSLLQEKSMINERQINSIVKEAFYNPALIKKMVYYFIDVGIFYELDDCWYSDELDFHLTAKLFEEHIFQRYEKLDETLKIALNKASITGYEIDLKLLSQPLGVIKSEDNLRRIERVSRLIIHTENIYQFENNTVYNVINDKMNSSEKKTLHLLIAEYLYKKIDEYQKTDSSKILRLLYIIKSHYLAAENLKATLHISGCYVQKAYQQRNFDAALSGIKEFIDLSAGRYLFAEQQLIYLEADIYMILGNFAKACKCLKSIKKQFLPNGYNHWIEYKKAYCLFNSGSTGGAQKIAEQLVENLDTKNLNDTYLLLKLDILLSGMYHHFGDIRNASRRYEQALTIARENKMYHKEYHYLLSISNMFLANELAIPKIEKSMVYFKNHHLLTSYAKSANNVAINYIYLDEYETAANYLEESQQIFKDICSSSVHYPINNLGTVYAHQQNYTKALELFTQAKSYQIEPFSVMWISMNIANCMRKLGNLNRAQDILNEVEKDLHNLAENKYLLERNLHISKGLLALDKGNYLLAYFHCEKALEIEVNMLNNDTYPIFISKLLVYICEKTNLQIPDVAFPYHNSFTDSFCKNLLYNQTHWGNFLFWEA